MVARALKIHGIVWLIGWLFTWAYGIKGEYQHPEDYSVTFPTGETQFMARAFVAQMIEHGMAMLLFWPGVVYVEVGLRMGWICKSHEIGRC